MKRSVRLAIVGGLALSLTAWAPAPSSAAVDAAAGSRLQGTAAVNRRHRVVGAVAAVRPQDDPSRLYLTSTDATGVFVVDGLPNGAYVLTLERSGLQTVVKDKIELKFPFRAVVEVTMPLSDQPAALLRDSTDEGRSARTITLKGSMRERESDPVGEVRVRLVHPAGKRDPRYVESEPDGSFRLEDLPAGDWILDVNAVGFLPLRVRLDLEQDVELDVSLVRQPADYEPSPLELMPPEQPEPPPGFLEDQTG